MAASHDSAVEQVRMANDIVEVVQSYIPLKRAGSTFRALCPFHQEKTPSFHVNPQRQFFHCFGCNMGGDVFKFVMAMEKTDFPTALRLLASRVGISLARDRAEADRESAKDLIFEINKKAAAWFHELLLKSPQAEQARTYLRSRDLDAKAAEEFIIGFAPDRWDTLLQWAGKQYSPAQLSAAGLVVMPSDERTARGGASSPYDRFRNRLMFPILDEMGRVAGFSGRLLAQDSDAAKYVNTPETVTFHKGRILFGLHHARRELAGSSAILCEGQIDVIRCRLAGFTTALAAQGTALTPDHARIIKRYTESVILAFDADTAGRKAAMRAVETFLQTEMAVKIAPIPGGEDPDSLIRKKGHQAFRHLLETAVSPVEFQIRLLNAQEDLSSELGIMRAAAELAALINHTPNPAQQTVMLQQASDLLKLPESALKHELAKLRPIHTAQAPSQPQAAIKPKATGHPIRELALAEHLLSDPALAEWVYKFLPLEIITDLQCRALVRAAVHAWEQGKEIVDTLAEEDPQRSELTELASKLMSAPLKAGGAIATQAESVRDLILSIHAAALEAKRERIRRELAQAESENMPGEAATKRLRAEFIEAGYDLAKLKKWDTAIPLITMQV